MVPSSVSAPCGQVRLEFPQQVLKPQLAWVFDPRLPQSLTFPSTTGRVDNPQTVLLMLLPCFRVNAGVIYGFGPKQASRTPFWTRPSLLC